MDLTFPYYILLSFLGGGAGISFASMKNGNTFRRNLAFGLISMIASSYVYLLVSMCGSEWHHGLGAAIALIGYAGAKQFQRRTHSP